jgi:glutathione S-transferase
MATVELYHFWSSVCSVRCRMALEEKGVAWRSRYIDLFAFDHLRPEYLAINPKGVVPTLVHNGQPVRESSVINQYIDAAFEGPKLTPSDPLSAARMHEFVYACDEGFSAIVKLTMVQYILPKLRNRWGDAELRKQAERRPTRFYQDIHGRAVRGEITEAELEDARATIEYLLDLLSAPSLQDHGLSENNLASRRFRSRRTCSGLPHWERINFGPPIAAPESRNGTGDYQRDPHFKPPSLGPTSPVAGMRRSG